MKTNREIINGKSIDIFGRKERVCASDSLIEEALENESDLYINLQRESCATLCMTTVSELYPRQSDTLYEVLTVR